MIVHSDRLPFSRRRQAADFRIGPSRPDPRTYSSFARQVQTCLEDGQLRYSQRLKLLKLASELGIGRFEANLIIAIVQHRAERSTSTEHKLEKTSPLSAIAVFAIVQSLILIACWWIMS